MKSIKTMIQNQRGFTLIESIVSIVLLGILGLIASVGFAYVVEGYVTAQLSASTAEKAQVAMERIIKELINLDSVTTSSAASITFVNGVTASHTITTAGTTITFDGDTLIDQVQSLTLAYCNSYTGSCAASWSASSNLIQITFRVTGPSGIVSEFSNRVFPRNFYLTGT